MLYATEEIPGVGKPYAFVVIEPAAKGRDLFVEIFVIWVHTREESPIPLQSQRRNYRDGTVDLLVRTNDTTITPEVCMLYHAKEWAAGAITGSVLESYQKVSPLPPFPHICLAEVPLHILMHLWGTNTAQDGIEAIRRRTLSDKAIEFLNAVKKVPTIEGEEPYEYLELR